MLPPFLMFFSLIRRKITIFAENIPITNQKIPETIIISAFIKKYTGILAVYCAMMLTVLSGTMISVALPTFTVEFGVQPSQTVWIINGYQLVITLSLLIFAAIADNHGYKRLFIIGVYIFTFASVGCALCDSLYALVACRVVQGVGASCIMSVNVALVRMIYPPDKLGRGMGVNAMVVSMSSVAGPTLAGALLAAASWHWLFLINVPLGIAAILIGHKYLPEHRLPAAEREKFDTVSAVECALILWLFVSLLDQVTKATDWRLIVAKCVVIPVVGYVFVHRQRRFHHPLLPIDLLSVPLFAMSIATSVISFSSQMLALVSLPFLFSSLGMDPMKIGLLLSPWPIGTMIAAPLAGRLVERYHGGMLGATGMAIMAAGLLLLYVAPAGCSPWDIAWRMAICGAGWGLFQTPNNVTIASSSPRERSGAAGGMQGSARVLGQTIGTTLVAMLLHLVGNESAAARTCLIVATIVAVIAAVMSLLRLSQHSIYQDRYKKQYS